MEKACSVAILASENCITDSLWENLKSSGVDISLFLDPSQFIDHCIENQPALICVSLDSQFKKIKRLPFALRSTLKIPVLTFLEKDSQKQFEDFDEERDTHVFEADVETFISYIQKHKNNSDKQRFQSPSQDEKLDIIDELYKNLGEKKTTLSNRGPSQDESHNKPLLTVNDVEKKFEIYCQEAVSNTFKLEVVRQSKDFAIDKCFVFSVSLPGYQGLLAVACETNKINRSVQIEQFKNNLIEILEKNSICIESQGPFEINCKASKFIEKFSNFTEFIFHYENETLGQVCFAFIKRERVQPKLEETDDGSMLKMSIKALPPDTPVTFSAFLRLPINKKYVKYLKRGSAISLEQVKRHSKDENKSHIYIPIEERPRVTEFYIQNTINWELALNESETKAS